MSGACIFWQVCVVIYYAPKFPDKHVIRTKIGGGGMLNKCKVVQNNSFEK